MPAQAGRSFYFIHIISFSRACYESLDPNELDVMPRRVGGRVIDGEFVQKAKRGNYNPTWLRVLSSSSSDVEWGWRMVEDGGRREVREIAMQKTPRCPNGS